MIDAQPVHTKQMHSKASQRTHTTNGSTSQTHPLHQKLWCRLLENSTTMFGGVVSVDADGCDCARIVRKWYHDDRRYKNTALSRSTYPKSHLASAGRLPVNEFAANTPAAKYANWYSEYLTVEFSIRRYPKTPVGVGNPKEKWATRISLFAPKPATGKQFAQSTFDGYASDMIRATADDSEEKLNLCSQTRDCAR